MVGDHPFIFTHTPIKIIDIIYNNLSSLSY